MAYRFDVKKSQQDELRRKAEEERVWVAEMDEMSERDEGLCYFAGNSDMVKIGFSRDVYRRIYDVRDAAGLDTIELFATAHGGRYRETYYHHKFREHRLHGEWFARAPEINAEIQRLGGAA